MKLDFDSCDDEEGNSFRCDDGDLDDLPSAVPPTPSSARLFSPRKAPRPIVRPDNEVAAHAVDSPPYKKIRALRLFDSPATPKTILQKSSTEPPGRAASRSRLFIVRHRTQMPPSSQGTPSPPSAGHQTKEHQGKCSVKEVANINPFTPTGMMLSRKRTRSKRELSTPTG